jgi:hypothetical protein
MEEKNAVLAALKALGDKIIALEEERDTQKMYREIAETKIEVLETENEKLRNKLYAVETFIEKEGH